MCGLQLFRCYLTPSSEPTRSQRYLNFATCCVGAVVGSRYENVVYISVPVYYVDCIFVVFIVEYVEVVYERLNMDEKLYLKLFDDTREEIKRRINMGNACYYSVEKLLSSSLLSKNLKVRIYKTVILPVLLYGCETWTLTLREEHRLRVFENKKYTVTICGISQKIIPKLITEWKYAKYIVFKLRVTPSYCKRTSIIVLKRCVRAVRFRNTLLTGTCSHLRAASLLCISRKTLHTHRLKMTEPEDQVFQSNRKIIRLFSFDEIDDSEMVFGEERPRIRHRLPGIHLTVGENLGKNPTREFQSRGTATVKEDEYEDVRWEGMDNIEECCDRVSRWINFENETQDRQEWRNAICEREGKDSGFSYDLLDGARTTFRGMVLRDQPGEYCRRNGRTYYEHVVVSAPNFNFYLKCENKAFLVMIEQKIKIVKFITDKLCTKCRNRISRTLSQIEFCQLSTETCWSEEQLWSVISSDDPELYYVATTRTSAVKDVGNDDVMIHFDGIPDSTVKDYSPSYTSRIR
ncbi:hypothetical protein ANN_15127 [Periplaneta americana]|uniref:Uncharacterized protein n=1 Tax=Periplaneta americana TaxID=6978 RepID=A0ABQ8T0G0_PERAM|nr:hypothetical protein ANN_15127 [Periplaneta americana]